MEKIKNYKEQFENLLDFYMVISLAENESQIQQITASYIRKSIDAQGVTFVLREGDFCYYVEECAIAPLWKNQKFPMESCISGWSMLNHETVFIPDIYKDARIPIDAYAPTFVKSLLMTPINKNFPIGALGVYWSQHHIINDDVIKLTESIANIVSLSISNLKLKKDLLAKNVELYQSNEQKDLHLATISHELRSSLNPVMCWTDYLLMLDISDQNVTEALKSIKASADVQKKLIDDLVDINLILSNKLYIDFESVKICDLVLNVVNTSQKSSKNIDFLIENHAIANNIIIKADVERIKQVFNNVIGNAVKFSPVGGLIKIEFFINGPNIRIQISDNGQGVLPENLENIFDRFFQADNSITRKHKGLGLGLFISKKIVEYHNGIIKASSKGLNAGSTFTLEFPITFDNISVNKDYEKTNFIKKFKNKTFLIIDDNHEVLKVVSKILTLSLANVITASSTKEAENLSFDKNIDYMLLDFNMPDEDGISFLHRIQEERMEHLLCVPVIAFTAFTDNFYKAKARELGIDKFLQKPFEIKKLVNLLE